MEQITPVIETKQRSGVSACSVNDGAVRLKRAGRQNFLIGGSEAADRRHSSSASENMNGGSRRGTLQYFDLYKLNDEDLQDIHLTHNPTPGKCLGYKIPV